jgi:hypothetical protein
MQINLVQVVGWVVIVAAFLVSAGQAYGSLRGEFDEWERSSLGYPAHEVRPEADGASAGSPDGHGATSAPAIARPARGSDYLEDVARSDDERAVERWLGAEWAALDARGRGREAEWEAPDGVGPEGAGRGFDRLYDEISSLHGDDRAERGR